MKLDFKIKFSGNTYYYTYISRNKYRFKSIGQQIIPYIHDATILPFSNLVQIFSSSRQKYQKKEKKKKKLPLRLHDYSYAREIFKVRGGREKKICCALRDVFLKSRNMQSYFRALENRASSIYMELLRRVDGT